MIPVSYKWSYKDANRDWWYITASHSGEVPYLFDGSIDFKWSYSVNRENKEIYHNELVGQYNEPPNIQDILTDFMTHISSVVIGFAKYGTNENGVA